MIRFVSADLITQTVAQLCIKANIHAKESIITALCKAREKETSSLGRSALDILLENADTAQREQLPLCQDTGMAVVFVSIGINVHIEGDIDQAIHEGVRQGYRQGYLRNSIVSDPIHRINTGDNTPAVIHYDFIQGDLINITVAPKGFGSENMGALRMLNPSDGLPGIEEFIISTVQSAGANPCPPVIVGAGVGGTMEKAALLAKQALLRDVGSVHPDPLWAQTESRLLERINALGIGPAGFGGRTTALGVHIAAYPTHIAGLPVAVNIGCHATRHETAVI